MLKNFLSYGKTVGAVAIGFSLGIGFVVYENAGPNIIVDSVTLVDDTVKADPTGDTISFLVKSEIVKQCPSQVTRFVWRNIQDPDFPGDPTKQIPDYHSIDNPPLLPELGVGKHKYIITLRVHPGLNKTDQWYERTNTLPGCDILSWMNWLNKPTQRDHPIKVE